MKTSDTKATAKRPAATRELIRAKALKRGQQRTAEVRSRVLAAMALIEQEMAGNDGVYPHKGGAVSGAEVARRAGVHPTTLFSPKQRELGDEVRRWLEALKQRHAASVATVKRSLADRISDWKDLYNGLAQSHRDTELELQQTEAELSQVREQLVGVSHERDALRDRLANLGGASVVPLRPKKR